MPNEYAGAARNRAAQVGYAGAVTGSPIGQTLPRTRRGPRRQRQADPNQEPERHALEQLAHWVRQCRVMDCLPETGVDAPSPQVAVEMWLEAVAQAALPPEGMTGQERPRIPFAEVPEGAMFRADWVTMYGDDASDVAGDGLSTQLYIRLSGIGWSVPVEENSPYNCCLLQWLGGGVEFAYFDDTVHMAEEQLVVLASPEEILEMQSMFDRWASQTEEMITRQATAVQRLRAALTPPREQAVPAAQELHHDAATGVIGSVPNTDVNE